MKHSRWEDLERSPLFIELNILESSPSLNRNENAHQQIQSRSEDAGLGWTGCLGLGTGSLSAPGVNSTLQTPFPPWFEHGRAAASQPWSLVGGQAGGRQRNAAEEIGIGRIQSPTFK